MSRSTRTATQNVSLTFGALATRAAGATANFIQSGGSNGTQNLIALTGQATATLFHLYQKPGQYTVTVTAPGTDPVAALQALAGLRDQGLLSETEYEAKRQELLGRI